MRIFDHPSFSDHEQVVFVADREAGLRGIIAVHNTVRGPALGGCRIWPYRDESEAVADVLRLSLGMTYKGAMADLPFGGGKMVVIADSATEKTPALLHAIGTAVDRMQGRYITGEDVGTTSDDMAEIAKKTDKVLGLPPSLGGSGDPSPSTARGCFAGIKASIQHLTGADDLSGATVAVQGLGHVGWRLCELLAGAGAVLVVTDIRPETVAKAAARFGARTVAPEEIYDVPADIFAPCALGAVLNDDTVPRLKMRMVAGSANNQLAAPTHAEMLRDRGILYAPDYVINAGGLIQLAGEYFGFGREELDRRLAGIGNTLLQVFETAQARGLSTHEAADRLAEQRLKREPAPTAQPSPERVDADGSRG
ncbi:Glu/Leu/Phe/Val dehydrogenase dimerization domain-containing protein [Rhodoligotrophos defluvii]|uniref:Glu/Leu/Phe/Val dehydrogenase dimerization domain-containing protein n=1 Tax=Rhodoligotrophos defluvii TaxID=2561934 RepID=UPI0010C9FE5D|nr:Glu/Leu/Phe/Val dehydrogenase dimerization domain-containing protein [Rhodoligotrophos defluvii]